MFCLRNVSVIKHFVQIKARFSHQSIGVKQALLTVPDEAKPAALTVKGWIKSVRDHKENVFFHINDGSSHTHLQIIAPRGLVPNNATFGSCVEISGTLVKSAQPKQQPVEVQADKITVLGSCDFLDYPFKARKHHSLDYVRQFPHLRPRTRTFGALLRVRNAATKAINEYFQKEGFCQVHTPILTSNDCEGAGEVFKVEPADKQILEAMMKGEEKNGDKEEGDDGEAVAAGSDHFFGIPTFLTVSGQLHLEVASGAFSKVYTFGPTFRAENSRSRHHLSEFYMIEAEMCFTESVEDIIRVVEGMLKFTSEQVLTSCQSDIGLFLDNAADRRSRQDILEKFISKPFLRITYSKAIDILQNSGSVFENKVAWGIDLHKEHERYLVKHFDNVPVFVTDYPVDIKPFYARLNGDDRTVAAVDLLAPDVGEICGGSLREERLPVLQHRLEEMNIKGNLDWYLDLRRFGSAPHGGFGIGFERYLQVLLGIQNIKDTIPFPRSTNNCKL